MTKNYIYGFTLMAVLICGINLNVQAQCNCAWQYRMPISINNLSFAPKTDLQVPVIVNTNVPITAGKMLATGDDIRFTDASCNNLPYWIESGMNTERYQNMGQGQYHYRCQRHHYIYVLRQRRCYREHQAAPRHVYIFSMISRAPALIPPCGGYAPPPYIAGSTVTVSGGGVASFSDTLGHSSWKLCPPVNSLFFLPGPLLQ